MTQPEYDDLWPGGPRFVRSGAGFALGTDSVLLADFAAQRRARRIADLGCGAGVLTVLLLLRALEQATAVGIELQPDAAQLARDAADHDLARAWNLKAQGGTVTLHRVVLVFHGGDVALCEEV